MSVKNIIRVIICLLAMVLLLSFVAALYRHSVKIERIKTLPCDTLVTIYGEEFSMSQMMPSRRKALMFFSHDCEFCQKEIEGIVDNAIRMCNVSWVFITSSLRDDVDAFVDEYCLYKLPDVRIVIEDSPELYLKYDISGPPALFLYDENGDLMKYKKGALPIETILKWIE